MLGTEVHVARADCVMLACPSVRSLAVPLLVVLTAGRVYASGAEVFGLGATEAAVAGASAARVADFSSGFYNPAGLAQATRLEVTAGLQISGSLLRIQQRELERGYALPERLALQIGLVAPVTLGGWLKDRVTLGLAISALPTQVLRLRARLPDEPMFLTYDNRTERLLLLPTIAIRLPHDLSIGIAVNYLAGLRGSVRAEEGATRGLEVRVDESVVSQAAVNLGVRWQALEWFAIALVYRQQFAVPFQTSARTMVAGAPINLDIDAKGLFTPHELVLGVSGTLGRVTGSLDLEWAHWSAWSGPHVRVRSDVFLLGDTDVRPPKARLRDTGGVRGGLEIVAYDRYPLKLSIRGGYAFASSPAPQEQPGTTNFLDGNRHRLALGGGGELSVGPVQLRLDLFGQFEITQSRRLTKKLAAAGARADSAAALNDEVTDDTTRPETLGLQTTNPGYPSIAGSGAIWAIGGTLTVIK